MSETSFHGNDFFWRYVFSPEYFKKHGVTIHHKGFGSGDVLIRGVHLSDTAFTFSANYGEDSQVDDTVKNVVDAGAGMLGRLGEMGKSLIGAGMQTMMGTTLIMDKTLRHFSGVPNPSFELEILLVKGAQNHSEYNRAITDSLRLTLPPDDLEEKSGNRLIKAPLGYKVKVAADAKERFTWSDGCTILIGDRLVITHMLCEEFSYTESPTKRDDLAPTYVKCRYRFTAGRVLTISEVKAWFRGLQ